MDLKEFITNCVKDSEEDDEIEEEEHDSDLEIIEEDSESEPELECDDWDKDCRIVELPPQNPIQGFHLMPTCSKDPTEVASKKIRIQPEIRPAFLTSDFQSNFTKNWSSNAPFTEKNVELIVDPFKVCVLNNFIENVPLLDDIRSEFNEINWNVRNLDLYEFFQSKDLKQLVNQPVLTAVYGFLQNEVNKLITDLTGLPFTHISATCSFYSNSDYLLVHDDQRDDRSVAFVWYLSRSWREANGGALQLLSKDDHGQPLEVSRDIYPQNNQFVFFPVSNESYHRVGEVLALADCRLSINGWFHAAMPPIFPTIHLEPHAVGLFSGQVAAPCELDVELVSWLNEDYLKADIGREIQEYFEDNSEICLKRFLKPGAYNEIEEILRSDQVRWARVGPPNRYWYEVIDRADVPSVLDRFLKLFQCRQFFELLRQLTGLDLGKKSAGVKYELQRWTPGSYSLLSDHDWYEKKELDLIIHFGCKSCSDVIGARTQYVTIEEEIQNALITIDPDENNLNLIYRDTARFTKYYSKQSKCPVFYSLICSYSES